MITKSNSDVPFYILDISRLLSRSRARVPTGIDRVELEYALYLCANVPDRIEFAAVHPLGKFAILPFSIALDFVSSLAMLWDRGGHDAGAAFRLSLWLLHGIILTKTKGKQTFMRHRQQKGGRNVYLLLSHHHLTRPKLVAAAIRRHDALFVPMVHDLIPLDYPEYAREREPARHQKRIDTVVRYADAVVTPSDAVRKSLMPYFAKASRSDVPVWPVAHGVHLRALSGNKRALNQAKNAAPYFICLGTVEARKNHLLLLNIWRRLIEVHGSTAPHLIIIGKRGWENEQVLDMIERSPTLRGFVVEYNSLPDAEVVGLLSGARALLFPSFAEGFGLPLAEALALGTPAICSDISVFREVGGGGAYYIDPLDGIGWLRAIEEFAGLSGQKCPVAQVLDQGSILDWNQSIGQVLTKIEEFVGVPCVTSTPPRQIDLK
ncbi:glycosyltransferase family 4 protein [Acetobacter sacchari]|uniref:Glycosyltransferase family 4 protein n=1 Tax=Acetobacter sacchari TaxID=2661687 RepID=A0ABS3LXH8_9PROT|nr:glycosyltransferase family 1 protein [Acetobacter sacchari]MBO1360630.1 glycosyltransferase family 4 protein [Acetobacter sacchari]